MELSTLTNKYVSSKEEQTAENYTATFINKEWVEEFFSSDVEAAVLYHAITGEEINPTAVPKVENVVKYLPYTLDGKTSSISKVMYLAKLIVPLKITKAVSKTAGKVNQSASIERQLNSKHKMQKACAVYVNNNILTAQARQAINECKGYGSVELNIGDEEMYGEVMLNQNMLRGYFLSHATYISPEVNQLEVRHLEEFAKYIKEHTRYIPEPAQITMDDLTTKVYSNLYSRDGVTKEAKVQLLYKLKEAVAQNNLYQLKELAELYKSIRKVSFYN